MVFTLGRSSPFSTILDDIKISISLVSNEWIISESVSSGSFACAIAVRAVGNSEATTSWIMERFRILGDTKYTWPLRDNSFSIASLSTASVSFFTTVSISFLPCGAVVIIESDRIPESAIDNVRGIGVADSERISICARIFFRCSFCFTPKRCSSSIISSERFVHGIACESNACVPIIIAGFPSWSTAFALRTSSREENRDTRKIDSAMLGSLVRNVSTCCCTSSVVGARTATCFPFANACIAARIASSVFPNPTSPTISRSIGCWACMSCVTSSHTVFWSGVRSNPNESWRECSSAGSI